MITTTQSYWVNRNPLADTVVCLMCDYNIPTPEMRTPYCPWCGREMIDWDKDPIIVYVDEKTLQEMKNDNVKLIITIPTEEKE